MSAKEIWFSHSQNIHQIKKKWYLFGKNFSLAEEKDIWEWATEGFDINESNISRLHELISPNLLSSSLAGDNILRQMWKVKAMI